jgi:DNA-binding transcriptional regulator YdaS (Cro superfamily)
VGTPQPTSFDSASELRAEIARRMVPIYRLAPRVGLHPAHLGQVLRGRRSLSPELATRIRAAISEAAQDRQTPSVPA